VVGVCKRCDFKGDSGEWRRKRGRSEGRRGLKTRHYNDRKKIAGLKLHNCMDEQRNWRGRKRREIERILRAKRFEALGKHGKW
jgi:hypothetical protein